VGWGGEDGVRRAETFREVVREYGDSGFEVMGNVGRC
jgi:hypothetical protein